MRAHSGKAIRPAILLAVVAAAAIVAALLSSRTGAAPAREGGVSAVSAAAVTIDLCADEGTLTLPGPATVNIWGFSLDAGSGCGPATLPGPVLDVNEGDVVTLNLRNYLDEPVSIVFPGQDLMPDATGAPPNDGTGLVVAMAATALSGGGATTAASLTTALAGDNNDVTYTADTEGAAGNSITVEYVDPGAASSLLDVTVAGTAITVSLATDARSAISSTANDVMAAVNADVDAAPLVNAALAPGTVSYTFTASSPGTYLYEAGTNTAVQVGMGLYGALIVRPVIGAYGAGTEYDVERVLVLSEIDPNLNNSPTGPNDFDFVGDPAVFTGGYHPTYFLINGEGYPDTDAIPAGVGQRVLLRYLNAGLSHHTMTLLGEHQRVIAKDGYPTAANAYEAVAETVPAGSTLDAITTLDTAASGDELPLYNRQLNVTNNGAYPGGMLTFIEVS